jgi:indolepyruvate ferredoxin oxidoreductase alpha subunit
MGVPNVQVVDTFNVPELERIIKEEVARPELSVVIVKAPCALLNKKKVTVQYRSNAEKCKKCGMCMKPGCPAITKNPDGTVTINDTMCNGCSLCAQLCKFGAIEKVEV